MLMPDGKTIVQTASGEALVFSDWLSRFIVAHPRWGSLGVFAMGVGAGWVARAIL